MTAAKPSITPAEVMGAVACPTCTSAVGVKCYFTAFERLDSNGKMSLRDGDIHLARLLVYHKRAGC